MLQCAWRSHGAVIGDVSTMCRLLTSHEHILNTMWSPCDTYLFATSRKVLPHLHVASIGMPWARICPYRNGDTISSLYILRHLRQHTSTSHRQAVSYKRLLPMCGTDSIKLSNVHRVAGIKDDDIHIHFGKNTSYMNTFWQAHEISHVTTMVTVCVIPEWFG